MEKNNKPIFLGVIFNGQMYSPDKIPKEFSEKHVCDPIIKVLFKKELIVG